MPGKVPLPLSYTHLPPALRLVPEQIQPPKLCVESHLAPRPQMTTEKGQAEPPYPYSACPLYMYIQEGRLKKGPATLPTLQDTQKVNSLLHPGEGRMES